jgi:orotate phosphoribosyltransferase
MIEKIKNYMEKKAILLVLLKSGNTLIIDDVITAGTAMKEYFNKIRKI